MNSKQCMDIAISLTARFHVAAFVLCSGATAGPGVSAPLSLLHLFSVPPTPLLLV